MSVLVTVCQVKFNSHSYNEQDKDFTLDPERYPVDDVKAFIKDIHSKGMHYGTCVATSYEVAIAL